MKFERLVDKPRIKRILREVTALSQVYHKNIVRYYTAWVEDINTEKDEKESTENETYTSSGDPEDFSDFMFQNSISIMRKDKSSSLSTRSTKDTTQTSFEHKELFQILYIQMELCNNKTLKEVIQTKEQKYDFLEITKQVLEGLVHIHQKGIIHRDLKPTNILFTHDGIAKIGDFGLAVNRGGHIEDSEFFNDYDDSVSEKTTTGAGTFFYMAPEIIGKKKPHISQKVDMYSLGIIIFELLYPVKTEMERFLNLQKIRSVKIEFPSDFPKDNLKYQKLLKALLCHIPSDRPSSYEVLNSDIFPDSIDLETINKTIRKIANPNSSYFHGLMEKLFSQINEEKHTHSNTEAKNDKFEDVFRLNYSKRVMEQIFLRHGSVEINTPSISEKLKIYDQIKNPAIFMSKKGDLIQLPYDLTISFIKYVSKYCVKELKRYCFDRVYRDSNSKYPIGVIEADFDIISDQKNDLLFNAEMFKLLDEIALSFVPNHDIYFEINHFRINEAILYACGIPEDMFEKVSIIANQYSINMQKVFLTKSLIGIGLSSTNIEALQIFMFSDTLEKSKKRLLNSELMVPYKNIIHSTFQELEELQLLLNEYEIKKGLLYNPFLLHNSNIFKENILLRMVSRQSGILASGGRYNKTLSFYKKIYDFENFYLGGIGVNIAFEKLSQCLYKKDFKGNTTSFFLGEMGKCDVCVTSFDERNTKDKIAVMNVLLNTMINVDFIDDCYSTSSFETLAQMCEKKGACLAVVIKSLEKIRVKNINNKSEIETSLNALSDCIMKELSKIKRNEPNENNSIETSNFLT